MKKRNYRVIENVASPKTNATVNLAFKNIDVATMEDWSLVNTDAATENTHTKLESVVGDDSERVIAMKKPKIRQMYFAAFTCLLFAVAMGINVGYSAPATYDMENRNSSKVKPSKSEITWIGSTLALGAMTGGIVAGPLTDKLGRKQALVGNLATFVIGWLTIILAGTVPEIIIGRFFCGLACGIVSSIAPMYCVEISTVDVRGILGSSFQGFVVIGSLLSVITGSFITWQYLAITGLISAIFGTLCFLPMPESPRWLISKGKLEEAISVMDKLQNGTVNAVEECNAIHKGLEIHPKGNLSIYKHPTVYKPAIIAVLLMFFQQGSGINAVLYYSSGVFEVSKGFMDPATATMILGSVQVIATIASNLIVDKVGRKILLILSGIFMALSLIALGTYYYMSLGDKQIQDKYSSIPLSSLITFIIAFSTGYGSIPWLLANEMVPIRARGMVSGLTTFTNGIVAFIVTKTFSEFEILLGSYGTFWFYSAISIIGVVFVILFVPETKGKKLEEIEDIFLPNQSQRAISISVIALEHL